MADEINLGSGTSYKRKQVIELCLSRKENGFQDRYRWDYCGGGEDPHLKPGSPDLRSPECFKDCHRIGHTFHRKKPCLWLHPFALKKGKERRDAGRREGKGDFVIL